MKKQNNTSQHAPTPSVHVQACGEINILINEIETIVHQASVNMSQLQDKLEPIMHEAPPMNTGNRVESCTELGLRLYNILLNLNVLTASIDSTYSRLEI